MRKKNVPIVYPNLNAELSRVGMTREELAKRIGRAKSTTNSKITGKVDFTLSEAFRIKQVLNVNCSIEELFSNEPSGKRA